MLMKQGRPRAAGKCGPLRPRTAPSALQHAALVNNSSSNGLGVGGGNSPRRLALTLTRSSSSGGGSSSSNDSSSSSSSSAGGQVSVAVSTGPEPPAAESKDVLIARIARAKAYKQQAAAAASPSSSSSSREPQPGEQVSEEQQAALRQQFLQTLQQAQAQTASQASDYNALLQQQAQKQQQQQQQQPAAVQGKLSALDKLDQADPGPGARPPPARPDFYTSRDAPAVTELFKSAPKKSGTGSADEAAEWLKGVLAQQQQGQQQLDPTMRMEEFTAAKEAAAKGRGAEIITAFPAEFDEPAAADSAAAADAAAAAGDAGASGEQATEYKPKVTTWGVFPRPQNISQAYGGGRNIRPGQDLETPEQKAQREAEYAAALQRFKKATFTDSLSDAELAAARVSFDEGMLLFKRGAIAEALTRFDEVREKVPLKSRLGGLSTLQAAVCYDTLGNGRQAEALYKRIQGHPTTEVSRKAKQLVFGFQAMSFLKTHNLNYSVKKEDYLKYFRRAADRNRVYVASEEEQAADRAEAEKAAAVAAGVVLGPVLFMAALLVGLRM